MKDALEKTANLHHGDDRREHTNRRAGGGRAMPSPPAVLRNGGPFSAQREALPVSRHR